MRFYCTHFNFCRNYRILTKENEKGVGEKTPAQKSGIAKGKWTLTELLSYSSFELLIN